MSNVPRNGLEEMDILFAQTMAGRRQAHEGRGSTASNQPSQAALLMDVGAQLATRPEHQSPGICGMVKVTLRCDRPSLRALFKVLGTMRGVIMPDNDLPDLMVCNRVLYVSANQ